MRNTCCQVTKETELVYSTRRPDLQEKNGQTCKTQVQVTTLSHLTSECMEMQNTTRHYRVSRVLNEESKMRNDL